jgi:hypothetical protein
VKPLDDRGVIVDMNTGRCWEVNKIGFVIWQCLSNGRTIAETVELIASRFSVDVGVARQDVLAFVESLTRQGLLIVSTA